MAVSTSRAPPLLALSCLDDASEQGIILRRSDAWAGYAVGVHAMDYHRIQMREDGETVSTEAASCDRTIRDAQFGIQVVVNAGPPHIAEAATRAGSTGH